MGFSATQGLQRKKGCKDKSHSQQIMGEIGKILLDSWHSYIIYLR